VATVIADTGPLRYLVLLGEIEWLPRLFETVFVPEAVRDDLSHMGAPAVVRRWIATPPPWLVVRPVTADAPLVGPGASGLDEGEAEALALAATLRADLILMDDRAGVAAARAEGFPVTGTLGILARAARRGFVDLPAVFARLKQTDFRCRPALMDEVLARYVAESGTTHGRDR